MAQRVVDVLESIDIDEEDADNGSIPRPAAHRGIEMLDQQTPVRQPCERVVIREPFHLQLGLLALDRIAKTADERFGRDVSLEEVILRAALDRLQRQHFIVGTGEDDDRHIGIGGDQPCQCFEAARIGQAEIENHRVEALERETLDCGSCRPAMDRAEAERRNALQHRLDEIRVRGIVFDQKQSKLRRRRSG